MFATIDIGTNSVLLLIGEALPDGSVRAVEDRAVITRLGENLKASGAISAAAAERTMAELKSCREICAANAVEKIAATGTEVLRTATNAPDFLSRVRCELDIDIEVISSEREAKLNYSSQIHDFGKDIVVIDIGGGSTEFIGSGEGGALCMKGISMGCVSLTEEFLKSDPPSREDVFHMRRHIHDVLEAEVDPMSFSRPHDRALIATAGTATTLAAMKLKLARYDAKRVHGCPLKMDDVRDTIDTLGSTTLEGRRLLPGLAPERADVILAGAELLNELMSFLGYTQATVSDRGVRWGLFYEKFIQ